MLRPKAALLRARADGGRSADRMVRTAAAVLSSRAWTEWVDDGYQPSRLTHTGLTIAQETVLVAISLTAAKKDV